MFISCWLAHGGIISTGLPDTGLVITDLELKVKERNKQANIVVEMQGAEIYKQTIIPSLS